MQLNKLALLVPMLALMLLPVVAFAAEVVVYSHANDNLQADLNKAFEKIYPDMEVKIVSTGDSMVERAIAENANPQADVIFGVGEFELDQMMNEGILEPYSPKGSKVPAGYYGPDDFYVGLYFELMTIAINTDVLKEKKLPVPTGWADLGRPQYKGLLSVAAPPQSTTGFMIFSMVEDAFGWEYMDKLHANIFQYNSSGSASARQAASGEIAIGISYDAAALSQKKVGSPIEVTFFDATPGVVIGAGLITGGPNPEAAKLFLDFVASEEGSRTMAPYAATTVPGVVGLIDMSKINYWSSTKPVDLVAFKKKWSERYE